MALIGIALCGLLFVALFGAEAARKLLGAIVVVIAFGLVAFVILAGSSGPPSPPMPMPHQSAEVLAQQDMVGSIVAGIWYGGLALLVASLTVRALRRPRPLYRDSVPADDPHREMLPERPRLGYSSYPLPPLRASDFECAIWLRNHPGMPLPTPPRPRVYRGLGH